ncbi:MAG: L-2-hydroxyglutarate oxidase [Flavobacteriales bacterium]|jgi:(S)-2-hydroxyglutarate dehydrogenase|nr:L-2-hydroxyglutarate oxidase [Flavobacteriales bacterium]MDG1349184.1 L-2-hydroxyglutarate oxidase [Flavobacteriales bacterium]
MQNKHFDIAVVGGGIVGLATAYQIQKAFPLLNLVVFEKEKELAFHQTGRNSGVIHSGLYYKNGSLKAKNCVEGRKELIEFAEENNVEYDVCGKIVVAVNPAEVERLEGLKINGEKNGLEDLVLLNPEEFIKIEPNVKGLKALWVPEAGIIDYKGITNKLAEKILAVNPNSKVLTGCEVLDYNDETINTSKGEFKVKHIIFCGGLFADRLATKDKVKLDMQIVGFRGDYYELSEQAKNKVNNLIYPVPNPEFPFLGVHFTRMTNGDIECGPNAVFTFKREGYNKTDFSLRDTLQALGFSGTWRLFINHWKFGLNEYKRAFSKSLFLKELQKMMPTLKIEDIVEGRSGVRAMALGSDGEVIDDFKIIKNKKNIHVLNAPSPAATACLAIGKQIMEEAKSHFNL